MLRIGISGRLGITGEPANPGLPGKLPLHKCVCVCVFVCA